jgi:hypothetical protein
MKTLRGNTRRQHRFGCPLKISFAGFGRGRDGTYALAGLEVDLFEAKKTPAVSSDRD